MGIGVLEFQFLLNEHKYKPINGEVLSIGTQTTALDEAAADRYMKDFDVPRRALGEAKLDATRTHLKDDRERLTDKSLFSLFSDCQFLAADISAYEGAEFIFDICGDVPPDLLGRFDFLMDGGTLDNVADPLRMMKNMTAMLKPGGRMFLTPWINSHPTAYVKLSPDWIMDFFAVNEFADAKVYVYQGRLANGRAAVWQYDPAIARNVYEIAGISSNNIMQAFSIAETCDSTTFDRVAIQKHYRGPTVEPYVSSAARFKDSKRPVFRSKTFAGDKSEDISESRAMIHIGST